MVTTLEGILIGVIVAGALAYLVKVMSDRIADRLG